MFWTWFKYISIRLFIYTLLVSTINQKDIIAVDKHARTKEDIFDILRLHCFSFDIFRFDTLLFNILSGTQKYASRKQWRVDGDPSGARVKTNPGI